MTKGDHCAGLAKIIAMLCDVLQRHCRILFDCAGKLRPRSL